MTDIAPASRTAAADPFERTLSRDRGRLLRLRGAGRQKGDDARARFEQALAASRAGFDARAAQVPAPVFDADLPVSREAERIVGLIRRHQVVVVAGETGSGKTTQLPKLCLAAGRGVAGMIGCTQPRRIAARAVARRVAEELGTEVGAAVGFQVRFNDQVSERSHIKFMTDGILLAEVASDRWLSAYDTLIVDEAHERSLNIDFLLGFLKTLLARRPDLKLIVTSATIDTARFSRHFHDAPVVDVAGRSHPVEVRYRGGDEAGPEDAPESGPAARRGARGTGRGADEPDPVSPIVAAMDEIAREDPRGDTLVFLSGEREIRDLHQALERRRYRDTEVLPLYARLSARDQDRVFNPGLKRRIVLATNVAETSLTVPRIRYVIDPGTARVKRYSPRQKLDRLHVEKISQASANQRAGRCGRVAAGICYRLYAEADFQSRPAFTDPEILRASLAGVILRMLVLGLGRIEAFPFLEAPDPRAVADGWQQLAELGAVDDARRLTAVGRSMARMPVDPKLARILVAANTHGCLREALVVCAFLGIQDPRERPADARQAADRAHAEFHDPKSEFVGVLKLWAAYRQAHEDLTQARLRDWCGKRFLGFLRMREWRELHRQLHLLCQDLGWQVSDREARYAELHRALIAGLPTQLGHRADKQLYEGPRGRRYQVFPGSSLAAKPPPWMLSATLLDTRRVWGLMNAAIEPDWAIAELPHLLARRYHDPHWSRAQGRVIGSEQISLFGLVLAPKRPVHYGALFPLESREIFVREGLVAGEVNTRAAFLARNLATLEQAREEEAKLRRAGLVADADWQARWYLDRLPAEVHGAAALEGWYRRLDADGRAALEWSLAELLPGEGGEADRYPKFLAVGEARLALHYRFEPGAEDDGVTLDVPLHLLNALDPARLSWLAPGFVEAIATALIRGLPKAQRRNVVPAPDFARAFAEAHPQPTADSLHGELARFLSRATGAPLAPTDFDPAGLEPHLRLRLRLRLRLLDRDGDRVLATSRDLDALRERFAGEAGRAFAARAAQGMAREGLQAFPDAPIPVSVPGSAGVPAFPALVDTGAAAALRVFAEREAAEREHPGGVRRLLGIALADRVRQARKQLPVTPKAGLLYASIESAERLREDLVAGALGAVLAHDLGAVRDAGAFAVELERAARALFPEAVRRLALAEAILSTLAGLRPALEAPLMGWARGNLDDLRAQLDALVYPGFLRVTPHQALSEYPRYLRAMQVRAERAKLDPARDQQRMLEIAPFARALDAARGAGVADAPGWQALRWELEELRVSLFAQELGTRGAVSPKRLARRLASLEQAPP